MNKGNKPILYGALSSIGLLGLYAFTMTLLSGWGAAVEQFVTLWYLMVPLALGFGVQVGLYTKLKASMQKHSRKTLAVGGTSAGGSMLACCVHHATDFLPILGLSGVSILLTQFQKPILIISLGINIVGIYAMLKHLKKYVTISNTMLWLTGIAAFTVLALWGIAVQKTPIETSENTSIPWKTKEQTGGEVTVSATPITLRSGFPASFDIAFETHTVDLDFDVETIARLTDELGTRYAPHWQGSGPGGHHRKGTLVFTPDVPRQTVLTLEFVNVAGVASRIFRWDMKKSTGN